MDAVLYWYKKGSNFKILFKKDANFIAIKTYQPDPEAKVISINFTGYRTLSPEYDYKLVLNNKIEYRIYRLETATWDGGCRILNGMANKCKINVGFSFPKECGIPVNSGE